MDDSELVNRRSAYQKVLHQLKRQPTETRAWQYIGVLEAYTSAQNELIQRQAEEIVELQMRLDTWQRAAHEALGRAGR